MRTIVDIPDEQVKILNRLSKKKKISRAEIIRQALTKYIASDNKNQSDAKLAFGLWKNLSIDGLAYQQNLRDEWD